jgi:hypothetical protein
MRNVLHPYHINFELKVHAKYLIQTEHPTVTVKILAFSLSQIKLSAYQLARQQHYIYMIEIVVLQLWHFK